MTRSADGPGGRLFSVPAGTPFLPALADALVSGRLVPLPAGSLGLAEATVYLPTRGAARVFGAALAERIGRPALLPRIVALGEADAAELDLAAGAFADAAVLAPPIAPVERRLVLARLVLAWARQLDRALTDLPDDAPFLVPASPADALGLAADLEGLMDALTVEGVPWDEVGGAVDASQSHYFRLTLDFVRIAAEHWPQILAERGVSDPASRGRSLVLAEAERLRRERPAAPVIVAGSLGSVPATRALIAAVAALPAGAVVLPGLDTDLDAAGWAALAGEDGLGHPQALLARILDGLEIAREAVTVLGPAPGGRGALLAEVLRPAETTDRWATLSAEERRCLAARGTAGLAVVEAADEREEALCAALALREAVAEPGRTAALVTPDRGLAARVVAELGRWGLAAEDAAGVPLAHTAAGQLARLAADVAASDAAADRVLALLAHPWVTLGLDRESVARGAAALEIGALRGPAPAPGFAGLRAAADAEMDARGRAPRPRQRLTEEDRSLARDLVGRLDAAFAEFRPPADPDAPVDLAALTGRHREAVERLRAGTPETEAPGDPSAEGLDALFDDLALAAPDPVEGRFADYPAFFAALAADRTVARAPGLHPRLKVLGLVEARLVHADRMVLCGLDEGSWPPRADGDAFLNRPMRSRVGLDPPERRIGQAAHDFVQAVSCPDAVVTRAAKRDGAPTVPSRFLQRLKAFSGEAAWETCTAAGARYRALARELDRLAPDDPASRRAARPAPRPDPSLFPTSLSVTEVETLLLDPYALYARRVLGLDALDPVAVIPGPGDRGTLVHGVLGGFAADWPERLPPDAAARLLQRGLDAFGPIAAAYPELHAEWWPRFERLAADYLAWEAARRPDLARVHAEVSGRWTLPGGGVVLTARADQVERRRDGGLTLIDFKTGSVPSNADVQAGFAPQLTLQAAMLARGAFRDLPAVLPAFLYVAASGGRSGLKEQGPRLAEAERARLVEDHVRRLAALVGRFLAGEAAFHSRPFPRRARDGAYDHLARVREWSLAEDEAEG